MNILDKYNYNLCVLGDELVSGYGDISHLGSIRRILRQESDLKNINLNLNEIGIKGATSTDLSAIYEEQLKLRFNNFEQNRLVIFMPNRDIDSISVSRSRLNLANMLDRVNVENLRIMVVGPTPRNLDDNLEIQDLTRALFDVCSRRNILFVDIFNALENDSQWINSMLSSEGKYPDKIGYALIAWLINKAGFSRFIKR